MRADDGFASSLEVVVLVIVHGVDASFDTATDGLEGVAHSRAYGAGAAVSKGPAQAPKCFLSKGVVARLRSEGHTLTLIGAGKTLASPSPA